MGLPEKFISCDWGTSNFRLRLVQTDSLAVLSEHTTNMGIKKRYLAFQAQDNSSQEQFFTDYLVQQLGNLELKGEKNLVIIASGMLSSSIGMRELPYSPLPLDFQGNDLISKYINLDNSLDVILVSGAKTNADVMRGEETQAIGMSGHLPRKGKGLLILPGTHSKHLFFDGGKFNSFITFMTGELFEVIGQHSVLAASLEAVKWDACFKNVFLDGLQKGIDNKQMASFFSIRANTLLQNTPASENYYFLSGLLIGGELAYLKERDETVYLGATGITNSLYQMALEAVLPAERIKIFSANVLEKALLLGQRKVLATYAI
ncbi:2-keto-3-deoxy-galactonokinase [Arenibacter aquaticus]|uniref:2-keto-3-deoxy-galactonokinase n=1 Tax=Arenibacter aquaticus TaxID=2489054 RepID=A0A3S0AC58_9FLAO|nr:2-dehydro-3-deoxygalactonokinase [Arenibacter aquaticus]RTE52114.1 2-keto-3-deoxy-galactonokinase [Arenibacter aquaticus]